MNWRIVSVVMWGAAVITAWRFNVPLEPRYVLEPHVGGVFQVDDAEFLTTATEEIEGNEFQRRPIGPLQIRDVRTGRVLRTFLDADSTIVAFDFESRVRIAARQGETIRIVRAKDGSTESTLDSIPASAKIAFAAEGKLVLVQEGQELRAFDATTGQLKWNRPGLFPTGCRVGPNLVALSLSQNSTRTSGTALSLIISPPEVVDAETGESHQVLKPGSSSSTLIFSSRSGRWIVFRDRKGDWTICDAQSGEVLWMLPRGHYPYLWFDDEAGELHVPWRSPQGEVGIARWKADDGTVLAPFPAGAQNTGLKLSADRRYSSELRRHQLLPDWAMRYVLAFPQGNLSRWVSVTAPVIIEMESQKVLGRLSPDMRHINSQFTGDGFFCSSMTGAKAYYAFPPDRNWHWLAGWALGPPLAAWGASRLWGRWQRRRSAAAPAADVRDPAASAV